MSRRPKIAFIFTHQIQYFTNVLQALHDRGHVEIAVFYAHHTTGFKDRGFGRTIAWDNCLNTTFPAKVLADSGKRPFHGFASSFSTDLWRELNAFEPDVVHLNGFAAAVQWVAWLWARAKHRLLVARGDGDTLSPTTGRLKPAAQWLSRRFCGGLDAVFHQGIENRRYWIQKGAGEELLRWIPCVPDNALYQRPAFANAEERSNFRRDAGAQDEDVVFVVSGKLEPRKHPADALVALQKHPAANCKLWFLGSGPLEQDLHRQAQELGVADRVHWWGFRNQSEIPPILQAADVLLHPSERDPWPYSILEGAMCGLALLLSDRTGSHPDLVGDAGAGVVFRCGDTSGLARQMSRLMSDDALRRECSTRARQRASKHTEERFCEIIEQCCTDLLNPSPR